MQHTATDALQLDANDPFKPLSHLFDMPLGPHGKTAIYLNGNSLGPKPKSIDQGLLDECKAWGEQGVRGHFGAGRPWALYHERLANSLARLVGARPEEVAATGTLTANLHFMFISFYRPTPTRYKIIKLSSFPSDSYAITSQIKQRLENLQAFNGAPPFTVESAIIDIKPDDTGYISLDAFKKALEEHGDSTSLIWVEAVHYLTGQYFDVPQMTELAHRKGCKIGLDLAHAIGNVPLELHAWKVDFAVWCSYKYLSAGPGAIGGLYVHEKYIRDSSIGRLAGWWGHNQATRFDMPNIFDCIPTADGWQVSNPGIFLLAALRQALSIFDQVDLIALREKNKRLVAYLERRAHEELGTQIRTMTPKNPEERGCQLSLQLNFSGPHSALEQMFFDHGTICDVRSGLIRVAPMGLYTTFSDLFYFVEQLKRICLGLAEGPKEGPAALKNGPAPFCGEH